MPKTMNLGYLSIATLAAIMGVVLLLPISLRSVESELEAFLLLMGLIAVTVSGRWSLSLAGDALSAPAGITVAVLLAGLVFRRLRPRLRRAVGDIVWLVGLRPAAAGFVFLLGLASGLVTAIVAALILTEIVSALRLGGADRVRLAVYGCYAIGLGSALTPWGGPLSAVVIVKLKDAPHFADFFFLARLLSPWLLPGLLLLSGWSAWRLGSAAGAPVQDEEAAERDSEIVLRSGKVYIFVMALVLLGAGLAPLAERAVALLPAWGLYWLNLASAFLDNATLAAAEIVPTLSAKQLLFALLGMLLAGGMLIPGNIPNIVCAAKLGIRSRQWAAVAVPVGLALLAGCFVLLLLL
jgi:predicted cation transporter